jgi:cation:H+ antiporter
MRIARYLGWREFVVAFFVVAFASSIPNLFVGINSALHKIPQLSFGEIVGGNVINLTIAVALAVLLGKSSLPADSRMVQRSAIFCAICAILPMLLMLDGTLGKGDGVVLLISFLFYVFWLFSKEDRFKKDYEEKKPKKIFVGFKNFLKDLVKIALYLAALLIASEGIVVSSQSFSLSLNIALPVIGILIVGTGNALPEIYFAAVSSRKGEGWMVLGDLMGSVIFISTLVLGIVALICPIEIADFSPFIIARFFLILAAVFFLIVVKTGKKITKGESVFLIAIYVLFLLAELFLD